MFIHLTSTPECAIAKRQTRKKRALYTALLSGALLLGACQEQTAPADTAENESAPANTTPAPVEPSDSASARIEAFQPRYVMQKQALQRRLQAEYESLQAADATTAQSMVTDDSTTDASDTDNGASTDTATDTNPANSDSTADQTAPSDAAANTTDKTSDINTNEDINTNIAAGERDLAVLQKVTLEPRAPEQLDETDIIEQYQDAMQALYAPEDEPLTAVQMNTLLNIASLVPSLFEHTEIADRLVLKSPALARLVVQHQVWQQIEAQQAIDMQNMKKAQQAEFEALVYKFNSTIKDYDEQIEKYEQTLESYQQE